MEERVFNYNVPDIPLWKWILLHFVKTYVNSDVDVHITSVCYAKKLFGILYIWKIELYNSYNGKLIETRKLERKKNK